MDKTPAENKASKSDAAYKYVGNGDSFVGIPARDLTADDVAQLTDEQRETVKKSGLYKKG